MTRSKTIKIVCIVIFAIAGIIWGMNFYSINNRLPNAKIFEYSKDEPAITDGLEITPLEKIIYTVDEYKKEFPADNSYSYLTDEKKEHYLIIVFKVRFKNTTQEALKYEADSFIIEAFPSAYHNGVLVIGGSAKRSIESGEEQEVILESNINDLGLIKTKDLHNIDSNKFYLVFSYYPEKKILVFD